jgi:hypothetical protein
MPISQYFSGKGKQVLADFIKRYGKKRGTALFYAAINKMEQEKKKKKKK